MRRMILGVSVIALSLAACGKPNDEATNNTGAVGNEAMADNAAADANSTAVAAPPAADFASQIAASDRFEIESGQLAASKASSADVKAFAQMLVTDHQKSTADLKAAASKSQISPNDVLDTEKDGMLATLTSAVGADFDRQYIDQQIAAHEKALSLLQAYAAGGDNKDLQGFATKASTIVQGHLDRAKALKK